MSIWNSISRLTDYYRRHGFSATIRRARLAGKRALFAGRMVVFYCDLNERKLFQVNISKTMRVERIRALAELSAEHLQAMTSFWNPNQVNRDVRDRFEKGASLWLVECENRLAGYGWTLQGHTIAPYYFPLGLDDVHLFDFHVFPHFRGRGINPYLIGQILDSLAKNGAGRAFIETTEWNDTQLWSLGKTSFHCLGSVRSFTILGHTLSSWMRNDAILQIRESTEPTDQILRAARSSEQ